MATSSSQLENTREIVRGGIYRHYKGKTYRVFEVVRHSETLEEMVYYECLYENDLGRLWVRPMQMFLGEIEIDGRKVERFALIERPT